MKYAHPLPMSLEAGLIAAAPMGVSVVDDLPGGWTAIIALHPDKVPLVSYTKHPPAQLMASHMAVAADWAR